MLSELHPRHMVSHPLLTRDSTCMGESLTCIDRTVKVWDSESGNCVQTLVGHRGAVTSLQLSDDMIISGSGKSLSLSLLRYHPVPSEVMLTGIDDGDVMVWNFAPPASTLAKLPSSPAPLLR